MRGFCRRFWILLFFILFVPTQALPENSVMVQGGGMQRGVRLGMTKAELISELGAPSRIKSEGRCMQYDLFDISLLLDDRLRVHRIYLGKNFAGSLQEQSGRWVAPEKVLADLEPVESVERLAYSPSPVLQNRATAELENEVGTAGKEHQSLPMEYRGNGKLYELYGGDMVLKYKAVFDREGMAFWLDHKKELYATVLYSRSPGDAAMGRVPELESVYFEFDRFKVSREFHPVLERDARYLTDHSGLSVIIAGHADALGSESYNQALSEKRALSVLGYLTSKGISPSRLGTMAYGESQPAADNRTPQSRARNRRVEFEVVSSPQEAR